MAEELQKSQYYKVLQSLMGQQLLKRPWYILMIKKSEQLEEIQGNSQENKERVLWSKNQQNC